MERKDFLRATLALCGAGIAGSALLMESCKKTSTAAQGASVNFTLDISQASNAQLKNVGGSINSNGVIVICTAANTYTALSETCTHNGCSMSYSNSVNQVVCPCHNGRFDMSGNVVSGPPPSPIKKYTVSKSGNILTVTG
ncbi:MAG: hypothetical protein RJA07_1273 [Bacteroidota bacterium]|jgi:cytochrome b6-f complex iron-sulfur subunit